MAKLNKNYSVIISTALAASALISGGANAQTSQDSEVIRAINTDSLVRSSAVAQNVTSVSQLSDVKPTDWAFTALQSLVERYGCIAGYPDRTFRGNQATSRYEFAAGLNACLDKINEIISAGLSDKVSKEDLATLQKLQEEFAAELATLRGRVDALDAKTAKLEAQQFSTTTKLRGEAIMALAAASDGVAAGVDKTNTTLSYRVRLNFDTSFTGKDLLRTRLQSSNTGNYTALAGSNSTRLSFDGFGTANNFEINRLYYRFPIGDSITAYVAPIGAPEDVISPLNPLESDSQGTVSRFGRFNPLIRIASSGGSGLAIAGLNFKLNDKANLELAYTAADASTPAGVGGLGGGSTKLAAQLVYKPSDVLTLGAGYGYAYTAGTNLGSGLNLDSIGTAGLLGTKSNTVVGSLIWDITKKVTFNTWGSWTFADGINAAGTNIGSTTFTSWLAALSAKDLFSEGDLAAVLFGQPLFRSSVSNGATGSSDTPYHLEALYRFRVSKNITITPGVYFVFNQNSSAANGTATVGVIRTTFSF
ncbi:MAG: iron uptake porin [Pseudanabaenaceae cyanobacterium bins.39]|nr:iron uptake porin [Pseudanabaenaceae cyanobacterium bins.39]